MIELIHIFGGIAIIFFILLALKELFNEKFKKKLCVICAAVSLTWLSLLILYKLGLFADKVIIALLLGQSILGIFYLIEKIVDDTLKLFRLPFLLTLTLIAYLLIENYISIKVIMLISGIWILFGIFYLTKKNRKIKMLVDKVIKCCKDW